MGPIMERECVEHPLLHKLPIFFDEELEKFKGRGLAV